MFLSRTVVWLSTKKIPFVLCGSRFSPAFAHPDALIADANDDASAATAASSAPSPTASSGSAASDAPPTRRQKRRAFDAVVRFCAAHQHAVLRRESPPRAGGSADRLVAASASSLSCGQALLVASFLAEALLCRAEAPGALAGRVAALLARAAASDRLETQPLAVLMSTAYALHRAAAQRETLGDAERALLAPPPELFFAILHQLRAGALDTLFARDSPAAVDVCLSFLLVMDRERQQQFLAGPDAALVGRVLARLARHVAPLVRSADYDDDDKGGDDNACGMRSGSEDDGGDAEMAVLAQCVLPASPSIHEVSAILENVSFGRASHRIVLMSYLLRVRRAPRGFSRAELSALPGALHAVSCIRSREARGAVARVVRCVPAPQGDAVLAARFVALAPRHAGAQVAAVESAGAAGLSGADAADVLRCAGAHIGAEPLLRLIRVAAPEAEAAAPLAPETEAVLRVLLHRVAARRDADVAREELVRLASRVDWAAGAPPANGRAAGRRLALLSRIARCAGETMDLSLPDAYIADLAVRALNLDSGASMVYTLHCVTDALFLVRDPAVQRRIVEVMIRFNGTRSLSSSIRFVALIAPFATRCDLHNGECVVQLLKMHTMNPVKLRQSGIDVGTEAYARFITNAVDYLLLSDEWVSSADRIREVTGLWINEFLFDVADRSRRQRLAKATHVEKAETEAEAAATHEAKTREEKITVGQAMTQATEHGEDDSHAGDVESLSTATAPKASKNNGADENITEVEDEDEGDASTEDSSLDASDAGSGKSPLAVSGELECIAAEHVEQVLICALRIGVKIRDSFAGELADRVRGVPLPLPAHFVIACKLNVPLDAPLDSPLLDHLLTTCDSRIIHTVAIAFLSGVRRTEVPEGVSSLTITLPLINSALALLLRRVEDVDDPAPFAPSSASAVTGSLLRFAINLATRRERDRVVLHQLREDHGTKTEAGAEGHDKGRNAALVPLLTSLEDLLVRLLSSLSAAHVRELALQLLDHLSTLSPRAGLYLLDRVAPQLCDFTPVELLYLARRHAPAEAAVLAELRGRDLGSAVDVADFVRVVRDLPPAVSALVIDAHAPTLTFAWATRLLSVLSARTNAVDPVTLCALVARLDALSGDATAAERHSAAAVLERFAGADADADGRVRESRDRLLQVAAVDSPAAVATFLATLPDELRAVLCDPLGAQIAAVVLPAIAGDTAALLALCQQLQSRSMLTPALRDAVARQFTESDRAVSEKTTAVAQPQLASVLALVGVLLDAADNGLGGDAAAARVLRALCGRYDAPADRLTMVSALLQHLQQNHSQRAAVGGGVRPIAADVCVETLRDAGQLAPSDYARLLQCASRLRCWSRVESVADFGEVFCHQFAAADAHSRCVAFKALSTSPLLFRAHEAFMVPLLRDAADVLAPEDLEMVLGAVLDLPLSAPLEALLDAIGTRVLLTLGQCRRSTLVRMLQCHAAFALEDDALVTQLLDALAEQCAGRDARLDTAQALTLLQATVDLDAAVPERLAVACFSWLEQQVDGMTTAQLGHAARLAVQVEMGYTSAVHVIATRALEQREAIRANTAFREAADMLCDEFSVELPFYLRAAVMRRRYQATRLNEYYERRRAVTGSSASKG